MKNLKRKIPITNKINPDTKYWRQKYFCHQFVDEQGRMFFKENQSSKKQCELSCQMQLGLPLQTMEKITKNLS